VYAQSLTVLGRIYNWRPDEVPAGSEEVIREAIAVRHRLGDTASTAYASDLSNLGQFLIRKRLFKEAEPVLRDCLAIRVKSAPGIWPRFNTERMLGEALLGQGRYAEAEPLLRSGYEGIKARAHQTGPVDGVRYAEALDRLIELYTATNNPDEVTKWQAERAKYRETLPPPREESRR
jgi:uncharacterized protein HemY